MKIYLANWCTEADFDAMRDDGGYDNIADQAYPNGIVVRDIDEAKTACIGSIDDEFPTGFSWREPLPNHYELIYEACLIAVMVVREFNL